MGKKLQTTGRWLMIAGASGLAYFSFRLRDSISDLMEQAPESVVSYSVSSLETNGMLVSAVVAILGITLALVGTVTMPRDELFRKETEHDGERKTDWFKRKKL